MDGHPLFHNQYIKKEHTAGFTIVELLIVIVVIGILAAITIVAYNGVSKKANDAVAASNAAAAQRKMSAELVTAGAYPASLTTVGLQNSGGTTYQYTVDNSANPATYCITVITNGSAYFVKQDSATGPGLCPGHSLTGVVAPTMLGSQDFSPSSSANSLTVSSLSLIPTGSWMIMDITSTNSATPVTPTGWTALVNNDTTNTMRSSVYAKIKTSSDTDPLILDMGSNSLAAKGIIFWGSGAGPVSNWVVGTLGKRASNGSQQYVTVSPSINTTAAQTLVLSLSNERTTTDESDVTSVVGATKWFFNPQQTNKIQTETVSYAVIASPGTSTAVTVTYPNGQTFNGMSFQIGLPPA